MAINKVRFERIVKGAMSKTRDKRRLRAIDRAADERAAVIGEIDAIWPTGPAH